jgi:hypothetical protein
VGQHIPTRPSLGFSRGTKGHGDRDPQPTRACRLAFDAYHERANIVPALLELPYEDRTRQTTEAVLWATKTARTVVRKAKKSK